MRERLTIAASKFSFQASTIVIVALALIIAFSNNNIKRNKMEIVVKITDIAPSAGSVPSSVIALEEVGLLLQEDKKRIDTLLIKGRKKIDLIGESCHVEISVRDVSQPKASENEKTETAGTGD